MTAHQPQRVADQSTGVALAMLSAALQVASLTSPDMGWLGWGALVPILLAIQGLKPGRAAALGLLTGILAGFGIYGWLFEVPSFDMRHAVLLALYIGAYPAIWVTAWALRRNIPLPVCATVLWLLVDYLRGHAGFLALPWGTLAQTQHRNLSLLQTASVVGEHGVTFLVALGNAALASLLLGRERREILNRHEVVLIGAALRPNHEHRSGTPALLGSQATGCWHLCSYRQHAVSLPRRSVPYGALFRSRGNNMNGSDG